MTSLLSDEGYLLKVGYLLFGPPVSASVVIKTIIYIKATEDKTNIYTPMLSGSGKIVLSFRSLASSALPKISVGGFG